MLVLVDHAAHRVRIEAGEGAVHHHLRHRDLAAHGFAAGFEINRFGEALLGFGARLLVEQAEPLGRRLGVLIVGVDLALGGDALAALDGLRRLVRGRRQRCHHLHVGIGQPARHHDRRLLAGLPAFDALRRTRRARCFRKTGSRSSPRSHRATAPARARSPGHRARSSDRRAAGLRATAIHRIAGAAARSAPPEVPDRAARDPAGGAAAAVLAPITEAFDVDGSSFEGAVAAGAAGSGGVVTRRSPFSVRSTLGKSDG